MGCERGFTSFEWWGGGSLRHDGFLQRDALHCKLLLQNLDLQQTGTCQQDIGRCVTDMILVLA